MQVDIKVPLALDRIVFAPRVKSEEGQIRDLLLEHSGNVKFHRSAEGIWVKAKEAGKLHLDFTSIQFNWTELSERVVNNRIRVTLRLPAIVEEIKLIKEGGKPASLKYLKGINGLEILDDHQWVNVACMTLAEGFGLCVFDEQGAGKTVTLIFAFDVLVERTQADFAMIIAPKSMVPEWPVDFAKFMPDRYNVRTVTGSKKEKRKTLSQKSDVLVTNFETAVSMEQELRAVLRKYNGRAILVIDESFFVKNVDAQRTQAIGRLREFCERAFVLCGTPAPNSPIDLIQQFNIVDFGLTFGGLQIPNSREDASRLIGRTIESHGPFVRHLKSDVLIDLPPKRFQRVTLKMQPIQEDLYRKTADRLINDLKSIDDKTFEREKLSYFAKHSALLQICSYPASISKGYDETPIKILALDDILIDLVEKRNEKVILWSFYTASLDSIFTRYSKYNPVRYDGKITEIIKRREAVRSFNEDETTKLFVGNPAAAGAGLNLQSSRYAIYESMSNQAAHYFQSLDRIHRRGQLRQVEYLILLCEGTIEQSQYNRLLEKEQMAQTILGDPVSSQITREAMLAELQFSG
jgi:SNF2 family DNA or RNA helicase